MANRPFRRSTLVLGLLVLILTFSEKNMLVSGMGTQLSQSIDPAVLSMVQTQSGYAVDDVVDLLQSFANTIQSQLFNLDETLDQEIQSLKALVVQYEKKSQLIHEDCATIDREIQFREKEHNKVDGHVAWMRKRIQQNHQLLLFLYDDRCHSHKLYINYLANAKQFLRLLSFLREAINSYNVVQIQYFTGVLQVFLQDMSIPDQHAVQTMLTQLQSIQQKIDHQAQKRTELEKKEHEEALQKYGTMLIQTGAQIQETTTNQASSEEDWDLSQQHSIDSVGLDKIDEFHDYLRERNGKGKYQVDFYDLKDELIALIDDIKGAIQKGMEQRLEDELHSNIAASEYMDFLDREIDWLYTQIAEWLKPKGNAAELMRQLKLNAEHCHASLDKATDYLRLLKRQIQLYSTNRDAYRQKLERQAELFRQILDIYKKILGDISDQFQFRIDDGLNDPQYQKSKHHHNRKLKKEYGHRVDSLQKEIETQTKQVYSEIKKNN